MNLVPMEKVLGVVLNDYKVARFPCKPVPLWFESAIVHYVHRSFSASRKDLCPDRGPRFPICQPGP